ncbi:hypothetical protein DPMN_090551 [Dreissena polymorpha]|uniref:Uncharacterized protein n=1 Tax=Dreissena polymorpha TaxID=45954 RepID=A0A9D4QZ57_DREPO|nr:hypothetical protein DPMN_090551 [Dreissena polymorpha]
MRVRENLLEEMIQWAPEIVVVLGTLSSYVGKLEIGACLTLWLQAFAGGGNLERRLWTLPSIHKFVAKKFSLAYMFHVKEEGHWVRDGFHLSKEGEWSNLCAEVGNRQNGFQ